MAGNQREITMAEVGIRSTLGEMARVLSHMERHEAKQFFDGLVKHVESVRRQDFPPLYVQAVRCLDGVRAYGLERIGYWPGAASLPEPEPAEESELDEEGRLERERAEEDEEEGGNW